MYQPACDGSCVKTCSVPSASVSLICAGLLDPTPCTPTSGSFRRVMPEIAIEKPGPGWGCGGASRSVTAPPTIGESPISELRYPPRSCEFYVIVTTVERPRPGSEIGVHCQTTLPFATLTFADESSPVSVLSYVK